MEAKRPATNAHGTGSGGRRFSWKALLWAVIYPVRCERTTATLAGSGLIALALAVGLAAYHSSNNILFITLALLLAAWVLSGVLATLNLRRVSWHLDCTHRLRTGDRAAITVGLTNAKRFWPTYALWLELTADGPRGPAAGAGGKRKWRERLAAARRREARVKLRPAERLDAGGTIRLDWSFTAGRRGRWRVEIERVGSRFPFGFAEKTRRGGCAQEFVVWPARVSSTWTGAAEWRQPGRTSSAARIGGGMDFLALRHYTAGDSHLLIHWKASARAGQLLVRQFAHEARTGVWLWLKTGATAWPREEAFELAVSFAATLAEDLFRDGRLLGAVIGDGPAIPVRRWADVETFLDALAVVKHDGAEERAVSARGGTAAPWREKRNLMTFADGGRGVAAYIDGVKAASVERD